MYPVEETLCMKPQMRMYMPLVRSRMSEGDNGKETERGRPVKSHRTMIRKYFQYVSKLLQLHIIRIMANMGQTRS